MASEVEKMPAHVIEIFKNTTKPGDKQEVWELPQWVKTALVQRAVEDLSYAEAAKRFNRAADTLSNYAKSPAAAKWLAQLIPFLNDPLAMARAVLSSTALNITLDRLMMYEAAKETNIELADKIARDLQDRMGIVAKKQEAGAISVRITMGGNTLEVPAIEAEWELLEEAKTDE